MLQKTQKVSLRQVYMWSLVRPPVGNRGQAGPPFPRHNGDAMQRRQRQESEIAVWHVRKPPDVPAERLSSIVRTLDDCPRVGPRIESAGECDAGGSSVGRIHDATSRSLRGISRSNRFLENADAFGRSLATSEFSVTLQRSEQAVRHERDSRKSSKPLR